MFEDIAYIGLGFAAMFLGFDKALFLKTSWLTEIETGPENNNQVS
jgi:hypothetical protein